MLPAAKKSNLVECTRQREQSDEGGCCFRAGSISRGLTAAVAFEALAKLESPIANLSGSMLDGASLYDVGVDSKVVEVMT